MIGLKLFNLSSSFLGGYIRGQSIQNYFVFIPNHCFFIDANFAHLRIFGFTTGCPKVRGSVVTVITNTSTGTGFIIVPSGHVVTCEHVVGNSGSIRIKNSSGVTSPARVIHKDKPNDIAVLEIQGGSKISKLSLAKKTLLLEKKYLLSELPRGWNKPYQKESSLLFELRVELTLFSLTLQFPLVPVVVQCST